MVGTAYYVDALLPNEIRDMTIDQVTVATVAIISCALFPHIPQIADTLVSEITDGIAGSGGVRCGLIGEMGCSDPLTAMEKKCLKAAALTQKRTGIYLRTMYLEVN